MLHEFRIALRSLMRAPAFTGTTVLTLALAAGANAAIFAVLYSVLLKPLPYAQPDRLVAVWPGQFQSNADLLYTRERGAMFSSVASIAPGWSMSLIGNGEPTKITVARVSGNMFETLGAGPLLGRTFTESAARKSADAVIVLSYHVWRNRFGADPEIIGRTVQVDGTPLSVAAVMPPAFEVLGLRSDAYTPFTIDAAAWYHRLSFSFFIARLAEGRSLQQADKDYKAVIQDLRRERKHADDFGRTAALVDLQKSLVGDVRTSLLVLGAAVGLILLIAGANVGTLQLTRAAARTQELAVRSALGASRGRLMRQLQAENLFLALSAGLLGVVAAQLLLPALIAILPRDTPRLQEIAVDPLVAGSVILAAATVGLFVGVGPAFAVTRLRTTPLLRAATSSESRGAKRTRALLVSIEVALAVVLTIAAGLMLQTVGNLHRVDPGFRAEGVLTLHMQPTGAKYRNMSVADYYDQIIAGLRGVPGVTAAGAIQHLPFSGYSWTSSVEVEGHEVPRGSAPPTMEYRLVTPGYFAAIGQPLLAGRPIERADANRQDVVVVNQALAKRFFGSPAGAIGRHLRPRGALGGGRPLTIVGVVGDVRHNTLTREAGPELYTSVTKNSIPAMMLAIRTPGDVRSLVPAVRERISSVDRDVPLSDIQTMDARISSSLSRPRLLLTLLAAFASVGLLLAVVGVYGVVAYSVAQRWQELGIMVALGADSGRIVRSVLREAIVYAATGLAAGIPGALAASGVMKNIVWGVSATDPLTYMTIAVGTVAIVVAASVLPALRAASVNPVAALKAG